MARLLFFGKLGDLAGGRMREQSLPKDVVTIDQLIAVITADDAALGEALAAPSVRFIVNEKMADAGGAISDGDEIAFLPPVSGG
ncbi:MAG: MoaD/ThiS family protein [Pseudomonadota bacterium]